MMLLPIFLFLASVSASPLDSLLDSLVITPLDPKDQIPRIDIPQQAAIGPDDARLNTMELIEKYGYAGELHKVTTSDGYILELHRIKGRANAPEPKTPKPIAFVMHGVMCSSAAWVVSGEKNSLGFILADAGYDVWLGNARGTMYARTHKKYTTKNNKYWDFSWHEIGMYDLPAMIDYTLKTTGQKKMFYLGHSQGTTSFFVMASERPEYQNKIELMFALAPIAYCGRMKSPFLQMASQFTNSFEKMASVFGMNELSPSGPFVKSVQLVVCAENAMTQAVCSNLLFLVCGFNTDQMDPAVLHAVMGHVPAGCSTKQFFHYGQLIKSGTLLLTPGNFQQYDRGTAANKKAYKSKSPPEYDLTKIKVPVSLYYSSNDWLAHVKDVEKLYGELGNPRSLHLVKDKKFNHLDFMWAKDVRKFVYDDVLKEMAQAQK